MKFVYGLRSAAMNAPQEEQRAAVRLLLLKQAFKTYPMDRRRAV